MIFRFFLVPLSSVDAAAECVARVFSVESEASFRLCFSVRVEVSCLFLLRCKLTAGRALRCLRTAFVFSPGTMTSGWDSSNCLGALPLACGIRLLFSLPAFILENVKDA